MKIPKDKIILKYRRSEPPYHLIKKEKKFKLDPELIKQLENQNYFKGNSFATPRALTKYFKCK